MSSAAATGTPRPPGTGDGGGPSNGQWRGITPLSLFLILILVWVMIQIQIVLVLGLLALLLGTILEGPVSMLQRRHMPRPAAIAAVYVALIGGLTLFTFAIVPLVGNQASTFREQVPEKLRDLEADWAQSSNPILNGVGDRLLVDAIDLLESPPGEVNVSPDAAQQILPVVTSIGSVLVSLVSLLVITFYYLLEKAFLKRVILDQINNPARRERVSRVWNDVERKVGGWMRGQLVLCLIIGTIATVSYGIIGLPFWPLLGLWAGLTEFFPIVGPWIGGVPAVILALTVGWKQALFTAGIIFMMQTLENWFLVPRVMKGAVGLTPLTVFVAILAGQQFLGVVGAILAIPVSATIQVILSDYLAGRRAEGFDEEPVPTGWRWMLSRGTYRDDPGPTADSGDEPTQVVSEISSPPTAPADSDQPPVSSTSERTASRKTGEAAFSWHRPEDRPPRAPGTDGGTTARATPSSTEPSSESRR
ncbi:MAG: AI-2E family transporter [Thermomicrobiales bacterium]